MIRIGLILVLGFLTSTAQAQSKYIARQGQVSFYSYTSVENIEATNNQAFSILEGREGTLAISMLMKAFVFEKALMEEHFNESYIESDIYPKSSFEGKILDFDPSFSAEQTKRIQGKITIHGVTKDIELKAKILREDDLLFVSGDFQLQVADFKVKIPPIVAGNIAETIQIKFRLQYQMYEQ
jgi:hypothetical protein